MFLERSNRIQTNLININFKKYFLLLESTINKISQLHFSKKFRISKSQNHLYSKTSCTCASKISLNAIQSIEIDTDYFLNTVENSELTCQTFYEVNDFLTIDQKKNIMNNDLDHYGPKTTTSEIDYTNLFRGLSTFELPLDRFPSFSETKKENNNRCIEDHVSQEKTYTDLSDLIIQEQVKQDHENIKFPVQVGHILTNSSISNQYFLGDESSMSSDSSYATSTALSTIENTGFKDRNQVKRLNTNKPVPLQSGLVEKPKRGRKPTPLNEDPNVKLTKKQLMMKNAEKPVVCFGNKVVEKNTDEYAKRRDANNLAVKKCRQKSLEKQKEREERMQNLSDENKRLNETVKKLCQELDVLKNIIIQMSPDKKLPANIAMMYSEIEN